MDKWQEDFNIKGPDDDINKHREIGAVGDLKARNRLKG